MSQDPSPPPHSSASRSSPPPPSSSSGTSASLAAAAPRADGPIICPGHSRPVPDLAFTNETPDGYFLISACLDNKAMLRDGVSGDWIGTFMGHKGAVWCARLNHEAQQAATAAADFTAKLWDALTGTELYTFQHKHIVKSVSFTQDGQYLMTGGQEKKIRIFDLHRPDADASVLEEHQAGISFVLNGINANSNLIFSGANEKDIRIWDRRSNSVIQRISTPHEVRYLQLTLDGSTLLCACKNEVHFYDLSNLNFARIKSFTLPREIDCVSYDSAHQRFVTGCSNELWVRAYDFHTGDEIACNKGHHGPVRSLAFAPNGNNYASGSEDGTIRIWSWQGIEEYTNKDEKERAIEIKS